MRFHLREVLTDLSEAGVRAAVLKGPYVALSYRNPRLRTYSDLDLLVPREHLERALEVLAANPAVSFIPPKRPRADKRDVPFKSHSGSYFNLDLHWDLFSYTQLLASARGATPWAWSRAELDVDHELGPLWNLPHEAEVCFLCTHAVLDHRFRLILFRDLAELARKVDWSAVIEFASQWKLKSPTYISLLIASRLTDAVVPQEVLEELHPGSLAVSVAEWLLQKTDLVPFREGSWHPLNVALLLMHDDPVKRVLLASRVIRVVSRPHPRSVGHDHMSVTRPESPDTSEQAEAVGRSHNGDRPVTVVYVGGSNRSGSTLLDRTLGQVPGWFSVGELTNIWSQALRNARLCGCGVQFQQCSFWAEVGYRAFGGWDNIDPLLIDGLDRRVNRLRYIPFMLLPWLWPVYGERMRRYTEILQKLYRAIEDVAGCEVVVDSSKNPAYALLLRRTRGIDARIVHLVRDSRGVAHSLSRVAPRFDVPSGRGEMPRNSGVHAAAFWIAYNLLYEMFIRGAERGTRVAYEEFVADPRCVVERIIRELVNEREPIQKETLVFLKERSIVLGTGHSVDGNPMRLRTGAVGLKSSSLWREEISNRTRRLVTTLTWPLLLRYGYLVWGRGVTRGRTPGRSVLWGEEEETGG
jgi:hypothetical protein